MEVTALAFIPWMARARRTGTESIDKLPFVATGQSTGVGEHLGGRAVVHGCGVGDEYRGEGRGGGEVDVR